MKPTTLLRSPLTGFAAVTLAYLSSMRGLLAIEHKHFQDNPGPIRILEAGTTILYATAMLFLLYVTRKTRRH